ncbi:MAG: hypothetical protein CMJ23_01255 [Phycisphaerae bacterium]|nr:hypothetical protein [Phycisphaerae bacterium]
MPSDIHSRPFRIPPKPSPREILSRLDRRERRWVLRGVIHELFNAGQTNRIGAVGGSILLLAAVLLCVPDGLVPSPMLLLMGMALIGGGVTVVAMFGWYRVMRDGSSQLVLRLERCGCCGHPAPPMTADMSVIEPRATHSWRCSECGAGWVGANAWFEDIEPFREAA